MHLWWLNCLIFDRGIHVIISFTLQMSWLDFFHLRNNQVSLRFNNLKSVLGPGNIWVNYKANQHVYWVVSRSQTTSLVLGMQHWPTLQIFLHFKTLSSSSETVPFLWFSWKKRVMTSDDSCNQTIVDIHFFVFLASLCGKHLIPLPSFPVVWVRMFPLPGSGVGR